MVTEILVSCRLSGLSPFAGEDDLDTLQNVKQCDWEFDEDAFAHVSQEARDFIRALLVKHPQYVDCAFLGRQVTPPQWGAVDTAIKNPI